MKNATLKKRVKALEQDQKHFKLTRHLKVNQDYSAQIFTGNADNDIYYYPSATASIYHLKKSGVKAAMGAVGQGKSSMSCWDLVFAACEMPVCIDGIRRYKAAIIRKTFDELKTTTFQTIYHWFNKLGVVKTTMSAPMNFRARFNDGYGIVEIYFIFRACANEADLEKIKSLEVTEVWINEITDIYSEAVIKNAQTRQNRYPSNALIDYNLWCVSTESIEEGERNKVFLFFDGKTIKYKYYTHNGFEKSNVIETRRIDPARQKEFIQSFNDNIFSEGLRNEILSIVLFNPCLRIDTNPPDEAHYFYRLFELEKPNNWELFKQPPAMLKIKDNGSVEDMYVLNPKADNYKHIKASYYYDMIASMYEDEIKVFVLGEFGAVASGKPVYPEFSREFNVSRHTLYDSTKPLLLSFDFGRTPACVFGQRRDDGGLDIVGEKWSVNTSLQHFIVTEVSPYILENFPNFKIESSVYDPSGKTEQEANDLTNVAILKANGLKPVPYEKMKKRVSNVLDLRINAVRHGLTSNIKGVSRLRIDIGCNLLISGLAGKYAFAVRPNGAIVDKPDKNSYSHSQDALQYLAMDNILTQSRKSVIKDYSKRLA